MTQLSKDASASALGSSAQILVVDDDRMVLQLISAVGRKHFFDVTAVTDPAEALDLVTRKRFDAGMVDVHLGAGMSGPELVARLRQLPGGDMPLAFLSGDGSLEGRLAAARSGADVYLTKPMEPEALANAIHTLVAAGRNAPPQAVMIGKPAQSDESFHGALRAAGFMLTDAGPSLTQFEFLSGPRPDLLLLLADEDPAPTLDFCRMLRMRPSWRELPIAIGFSRYSTDTQLKGRLAGADDCFALPLKTPDVARALHQLAVRFRQIKALSERDALTGLYQRRAFMESAGAKLDEAQRHNHAFAVCMIDVDHFKRVNDTHGHGMGDQVLRALGRLLQVRLRAEDVRGRWGGEEFCVAFPRVGVETVCGLVNRLLEEFRSQQFEGSDGRFQVSFSAGMAERSRDGGNLRQLIETADRRLFLAKSNGRGQVICV